MLKSFLAVSLLLISLTAFSQDKKQCQGKTKAGTQCQHKVATTYCKQHDTSTPRCGDSTKTGTLCKFIVKVPGNKCHNHKNK